MDEQYISQELEEWVDMLDSRSPDIRLLEEKLVEILRILSNDAQNSSERLTDVIELKSELLETIHSDLLFLRKSVLKIIENKVFLSIVDRNVWQGVIGNLEELFDRKNFVIGLLSDLKKSIMVMRRVENARIENYGRNIDVRSIEQDEDALISVYKKVSESFGYFTDDFRACVDCIILD